jgi:hypothetical protein
MRVVEELFNCTLDRRPLVPSPSTHSEEQWAEEQAAAQKPEPEMQ